jgi:hypothetical protein
LNVANTHIFVAKSILGTTAVWRQRTLAAHPTDKRNAHASELLELLSSEPATSVPAEISGRLNGYSDEEFGRVAVLVSRQVGFRIFPGSLTAFVQEVMNRIDENRAEIDADFPSTVKREATHDLR